MEMAAAEVAMDVDDQEVEEVIVESLEVQRNPRDCAVPLAIMHLTADRKEPQIECEPHGKEQQTMLVLHVVMMQATSCLTRHRLLCQHPNTHRKFVTNTK